tara:strand:+ start:2561 stop:4273 length:1713 start_codon:yes stop_codon:yes gene_type:complete
MKNLLRDIFFILKYFKKNKIFFLILSMILVSILELIGISLVIPFVTSIIDPEYVDSKIAVNIKNYVNINQLNSLSNILILIILGFYILKNLFVIFVLSKQWKYSMNLITLVRMVFFKRYLNQSYVDFIKKDHSELISNIMNVSATFGSTFIVNLLVFISEILIVFSIIILLFFFNLKLTFCLMVILFLILFIYYQYISKRLKVAGLKRVESDEKIINYSKLSFQNIKELKLFNKQDYFISNFFKSAELSEKSNYFYQVSAQYPRIGMEIFAILGICTLTLIMNYFNFTSLDIITTLAFYGVSIFRILPSANKLMFAFQSIRFSKESLNIIIKELKNNKNENNQKITNINLKFKDEIVLEDLSFGYQNENLIIKNLNFRIKKGNFIGIKGGSGTGKTTLIDILMGLINPSFGKIKSDGVEIQNNILRWRDKCGYVPQNITLMNDTISSNIAFGEYKNEINIEKVKNSLQIAGLNNFVNNLAKKEETRIGENGLSISGGQRQRLAIARALYRNPEILFFDEATSALDKNTENIVIDSIRKLKGHMTIIFVSHNQKIFDFCDDVIDLDKILIN